MTTSTKPFCAAPVIALIRKEIRRPRPAARQRHAHAPADVVAWLGGELAGIHRRSRANERRHLAKVTEHLQRGRQLPNDLLGDELYRRQKALEHAIAAIPATSLQGALVQLRVAFNTADTIALDTDLSAEAVQDMGEDIARVQFALLSAIAVIERNEGRTCKDLGLDYYIGGPIETVFDGREAE